MCFLGVVSCGPKETNESKFYKFSDKNWIKFKRPVFDFKIQNLESLYEIDMICELEKDSKVKGFPFDIILQFPDGTQSVRTYKIDFFEDFSTNSEGYKVYRKKLRANMKISKPGNLKVEILNRSSKYDNPGIVRCGIQLTSH